MARSGSDALVKKNSKLQAFLKRSLGVDEYEKIRAHDSCIICSERENKAFKYVVLSDEWICLTENPPKKISYEIHMRDLLSVQLMNTYPDFLSGDERERCQHIVVKYLTDRPPKGKRAKKDKNEGKSPRGNLSARGSVSGSLSARSAMSYRGSISARSISSMNGKGILTSRSETALSLYSKNNNDHDTARSGKRVQFGESHSQNTLTVPEDELPISRKSKSLKGKNSSKKEDIRRTKSWDVNAQKSPRKNTNDVSESHSIAEALKLDLGKLNESDSDEENRLSIPVPSLNSIYSSQEDLNPNQDGAEEENNKKLRETEINIYIMDGVSSFLMLTKCAWDNYLIRSTLEEDPQYALQHICFTPSSSKGSLDVKFELLFRQMQTELLLASSMEQVFYLVREMKAAAERNFVIRKLFWKPTAGQGLDVIPELFSFIVHQLHTYLPNSPNYPTLTSEEAIDEREDELTLVVLLAETLALMFRETEIVPGRLSCLKSGHGQTTRELIRALTCQIEIPGSPPPKKHGRVSVEWTFEEDNQLRNLWEEYTQAATSVLFELLHVGLQSSWSDSADSFFNIGWLVKVIEKLPTKDKFVDNLISQVLRLIHSGRQTYFTPSEALQAYHQFSVLHLLMEYSPAITAHIKSSFFEEFKYFVQGAIILRNLPEVYLIRGKLVKVIEDVMSDILDRTIKLDGR